MVDTYNQEPINRNVIRRVNLKIPSDLTEMFGSGLYVRMVLHHQENLFPHINPPRVSLYLTGGNGSIMRNEEFHVGTIALEPRYFSPGVCQSYSAKTAKAAVEGKLPELLRSAYPGYRRVWIMHPDPIDEMFLE